MWAGLDLLTRKRVVGGGKTIPAGMMCGQLESKLRLLVGDELRTTQALAACTVHSNGRTPSVLGYGTVRYLLVPHISGQTFWHKARQGVVERLLKVNQPNISLSVPVSGFH